MPDPQSPPGTTTNLAAERRSMRVSNSEKRAQAAEKLKLEGNAKFVKGDWVGAADLYAQAINIHGPKPVLLSNMAAAYLKLELFDEAEWATTTALEYDPSYVKARYRRAMARKGLTRYKSAKSDLKYMLKQEPKSEEAKKELQDIEARMKADPGLPEEPGDKLPHPDDLPWTLLSESETEDCKHAGNYTPCRFYNHSGCAKGAECTFSHAPDAKSVRDEIGKNVCLHFLIGDCEFGAKCLYSHSRKYLPPQSWWDDPVQLQAARMTLPYVDDYTDHRELRDLLLKYPSARTYASLQVREAVLFHLKHQLSDAKAKVEQRKTSKPTATSTSTATTGAATTTTTTQAPQARAKFVLVLSLDWQDALASMHSHLISGLEKKIAAVHIRNSEQMPEALECLESPSLVSVLITDTGIMKREYAKILHKLVAYVKNGGSVAFGGAFVCFIRPTDFSKFMKTTWGLNWEMGSYFRSQFSVNPSNKIVKKSPSLVKSYSMKCSHITGIQPEMAVYHQTDQSYTQSLVFAPKKTSVISTGEAPAVSASLGKGRLSILGDVNQEDESTNTVLAMLGVLDSPQEPQAEASQPQTPKPLQAQASQAESSKSAKSATKTEDLALVKEDSNKITDKFVLILELEGDTHVAQKFSRQLSELSKKIVVKTLYEFDVREAQSLLTSPNLHGVYLMDEGIQNIQNLGFRIALGPYVHSGGLVVFGGMFGPNIEHDTIYHIFATFGLKWTLGSTCRCEAQLNRHHETAARNPTLSEAFNLKAVHLQGFHPEHLFYEQYIDEDETNEGPRPPRLEAPILRAHVGKGHVGYIGDIGPEPESTDVLLSMFELLTPPKTLEPYSQRFLIMLTGFEEPLLQRLVPDFMKDLRGKVEVVMGLSDTGLSHARIVDLLSSKDLIGVLVGDTNVLQPDNAYLLSRLVEYSKNGGTLVFGWQFSKDVSTLQFRPLFRDNWGLDWDMEGNFECSVKRNFHNPLFKDKQPEELNLPKKTRVEGIHVKGITKEMAVYFALTQKKLWNPDKNIFMSAVVFAEVQKGRLGYIGSANLDGEGRDIIYTMFGLV